MPDDMQNDDTKEAKLAALRRLREGGFYEPELDNPEGLNLDEASPTPAANPQQTMQANPQPLEDALKRKRQDQIIQDLLDKAKQ